MLQDKKLQLEVYRDDEKFFGIKIKLNPQSNAYFSYAVTKDDNLNYINDVLKVISDYIFFNFKNIYKPKDNISDTGDSSNAESDETKAQ